MGLNTKNSGSLTGKTIDKSGEVEVRFLTQVYVASLNRNSEEGETARISQSDANRLVAMKYAEVITAANQAEVDKMNELNARIDSSEFDGNFDAEETLPVEDDEDSTASSAHKRKGSK